jgi:D-xylose reductase
MKVNFLDSSVAAAQVLLRWVTQRNIAVIPKTNDHKRLLENLQCNDFDLSEEDIKAISGLNKNLRFNDPADIDPRMAIFA